MQQPSQLQSMVTVVQVVLLEGCNMNDATVQVLASSCPKLKEVSIKGSMSCSDKSVHLLLQEKVPVSIAAL